MIGDVLDKVKAAKEVTEDKKNQEMAKSAIDQVTTIVGATPAARAYLLENASNAITETPELLGEVLELPDAMEKSCKAYENFQNGTLSFDDAVAAVQTVKKAVETVYNVVTAPLKANHVLNNYDFLNGVRGDDETDHIEACDFFAEVEKDKAKEALVFAFARLKDTVQIEADAEVKSAKPTNKKESHARCVML